MPLERASSTLLGSYGWSCRNITPESCFWKPLRILISVDLPAPLSPSRPSTSPLRWCRLTSRSAVTGPKRLAMCSTRRTSSGDDSGPTARNGEGCRPASPGGVEEGLAPASPAGGGVGLSATMPSPNALDVDVRGHGHDDRKAGVEQLVVRVHALQDQAVQEHAEEQRPDEGADDGPRAP